MEFFGVQTIVFMAMVFIAVVLLASSMIVPTVGSQAQASRRLKRRIFSVLESIDESTASILRQRFYDDLSSLERALDVIPGMPNLRHTVEQSGVKTKAYKIVLYSISLALISIVGTFTIVDSILFSFLIALGISAIPIIWIYKKRNKRLALFEEQLPDALTMMARALQAGHPFNETIKMIGEEMSDPIASEFRQVFNDINYGLSTRAAFMALMTRVPSISVNTLVTAILIQTESGGRLSEIVNRIATVIRSRFKLSRKVRSLSAEGRLSAWVLTLLPFALALVISITTPSYLPVMFADPIGMKLIGASFFFVILGIIWMRKIIRFKY